MRVLLWHRLMGFRRNLEKTCILYAVSAQMPAFTGASGEPQQAAQEQDRQLVVCARAPLRPAQEPELPEWFMLVPMSLANAAVW